MPGFISSLGSGRFVGIRLSVLQRVVHRVKPAVGGDVVSIKDGDGIVLAGRNDTLDAPRKHIALPRTRRLLLPDERTGLQSPRNRRIRAVVSKDDQFATI